MRRPISRFIDALVFSLSCAFACVTVAHAAPQPQEAGSAAAMRALHAKLAESLAHSPLQRAVHLDSVETDGGLQGDVHAVVDHPLSDVRAALGNASRWCDMLILHINNRSCVAQTGPKGEELLRLGVVRRFDLPASDAFELGFVHRIVSDTPDYFAVDLSAEEGPLGTSHHHVLLEATPLDAQRTFLHFGYAYDHNTMARFATMAYLATFGSHKMGFTVVGQTADAQPEYIRGLRGLMERNAMRYFLTLDAFLDAHGAPPAVRPEKRLRLWFAAVEKYPAQLHETDLDTYLALKREDREREQAASQAPQSQRP